VIENSDGQELYGPVYWQVCKKPVDRPACFYDGGNMRVIRIGRDIYRVGADGSRESLHFSAQEMLDLYDWVLLNYKTLEGDKQNESTHSVQDERGAGVGETSQL